MQNKYTSALRDIDADTNNTNKHGNDIPIFFMLNVPAANDICLANRSNHQITY